MNRPPRAVEGAAHNTQPNGGWGQRALDGGLAKGQGKGARGQLVREQRKASQPVTTLMFRNLPRKITAQAFIAELSNHVYLSKVDYVYLPWCCHTDSNIGYAFVNFTDATVAAAVSSVMQGRLWIVGGSRRVSQICPAHVQGLAANVLQFSQRMDSFIQREHLPVVFNNGEMEDFYVSLARLQRQVLAAPADSPIGLSPPLRPGDERLVPPTRLARIHDAASIDQPVQFQGSGVRGPGQDSDVGDGGRPPRHRLGGHQPSQGSMFEHDVVMVQTDLPLRTTQAVVTYPADSIFEDTSDSSKS